MLLTWRMSPVLKAMPAWAHGMSSSWSGSYSNWALTKICRRDAIQQKVQELQSWEDEAKIKFHENYELTLRPSVTTLATPELSKMPHHAAPQKNLLFIFFILTSTGSGLIRNSWRFTSGSNKKRQLYSIAFCTQFNSKEHVWDFESHQCGLEGHKTMGEGIYLARRRGTPVRRHDFEGDLTPSITLQIPNVKKNQKLEL